MVTKKRKTVFRRVLALGMAFAMTLSVTFSGNVILADETPNSPLEERTSPDNFENNNGGVTRSTTSSAVVASGAACYVFDASTLQQDAGTLTEDTTFGTNGFFTAVSLKEKAKIYEPGVLESGYYTYTKSLRMDGSLNKSGQAGIKFEIPEGKNAQITIFAAAKSDKESILSYSKDGQAVVKFEEGALNYQSIGKYVYTLDAGTYYLGGSNGGDFYYIEVKYIEKYMLDAAELDLDLFGGGKISANTTVGTNQYFTLNEKGNKIEMKDLNGDPHVVDGESYTKAVYLTGGAKTNGQAAIAFETKEKARVTIYAAAKSDAASNMQYMEVGDSAYTSVGELIYGSVMKYTLPTLDAGSYYLGGSNGAYIFKIEVEYIEEYALDAMDSDIQSYGDITTEVAVGDESFYTLIANSSSKIQIKSVSPLAWEGVSYSTAIQLTGAPKNYARTVKFTLNEMATVTILADRKGASSSSLEFKGESDEAYTVIGELVENQVQKFVLTDLKPGTYYIAGTGGANIFRVVAEYDPSDVAQTPWEEVENPVIDSVTVDEEGNFVVKFTAVIDANIGAEKVRVVMQESGYEMECQILKTQADSVIMRPLWSGNYSFIVTAQRSGQPDKSSQIFNYNNYILAVPKPVITWVQNKGNGSVYVDWINVEDADSFSISYKLASDTDYTMAANELTTGEYTLEGLSVGSTYDIKVEATRNTDGFVSFATEQVTVSEQAEQNWYVAIVGSAQEASITTSNGASYELISQDNSAKIGLLPAETIANTSGTISFAGKSSGKISDDEDGYMYYFTKIDPDTENFSLEATFTITDISLTPDNQTGFGVMAADMLGINYYGAVDYYHKYINSVSSLYYSSKSTTPMMRAITGYESVDTSNNDDVERTTNQQKFQNTTAGFEVGNSYTFALEKTNDAFIATCNGETLQLDDTSILSVQEDGTLCIGVMVARKVSAEISNIKFSTSESTGVTAGEKEEIATPKLAVYSSDTCGASTYEYICVPTVNGTLTIKAPNGKIAFEQEVKADEVIRVPVAISAGTNTIQASFKPDASQQLTSYDTVTSTKKVNCVRYGKEGETIIVSPSGSADGKGTNESPLDLTTALSYAQPGQVIFLKNGTYTSWGTIPRSVCGTEDKPITLLAETRGEVIFDGAGLSVIGDYWHIYGLYVKDSTGVGIQISGNYNTIEMCTVEHAANSGIQLSRSGSASNSAGIEGLLWPSYNLVKNCESFDNCDAGRNDADGFAAKLTCGEGNRFYGCISHHNIDDGWDLYAKSVSGEIGKVEIENCVAYSNGWLTTDDTSASDYVYGEGNGFKLGGGYLKGGHMLINSVTFNNGAKGVTSNSCPDCGIEDVTSYHNSVKPGEEAYNIGLNTKVTNVQAWKVSGLISMANAKDTTLEDLIPFSLHDVNNYIYDGNGSYNSQGEEALDSWFESTDVTIVPTRNDDGTINMHGLLVLTNEAPEVSGARLDITSEQAISVTPEITTIVSTVDKGSSTSNTVSRDDDDDDDDSSYSDAYIGQSSLNNNEQNKVEQAVQSVFGSSYYIYSAEKTTSGICIVVKSGDVIFSKNNGTLAANEWQLVGKDWYYFEANNKAASGWKMLGGKWYYLNDTSKKMETGWLKSPISNKWYYLDNKNGDMQTGWKLVNNKWYYLDDKNGDMQTGWKLVNNKWYYLDLANGDMKSDWQLINNKWYFMDLVNGDMKTGWQQIRGKWYYFDPTNGDCFIDTTTPDGYVVDENGAWIQ